MNQDLLDKAKELGIELTRPELHCINVKKSGLTVKDLRDYIEGLDDSLELETEYDVDDYYLNYFELYHPVIVDKTEQDLQGEIDQRLKQLERNKEEAAKRAEVLKISDLAKIKSLEAELKKLKRKHKV